MLLRLSPLLVCLVPLSCSRPAVVPEGLVITAAERQLARQVYDKNIAKSLPQLRPPVGNMGVDLLPLIEQSGELAYYKSTLAAAQPQQLARLQAGWAMQKRVYSIAALLDYPDLEVRHLALKSLRSLGDRRAAVPLIAAAKSNAFACTDPELEQLQMAYRREMANVLGKLTKVQPYLGPPPYPSEQKQIFAFDFGSLDHWIEAKVFGARVWTKD